MKKILYLCVLCFMVAFCAAPVQAEDARHAAFLKVAKSFVEDHKLPNGEAIDKEELSENFSDNKLAICDVDGDGKAELLVQFQSGSVASNIEFVCGFDESTGKLSIKFTGTPGAQYFNNGCIKEMASHNQGLAGEFWPYSFSKYNAKKGEYELKGSVDAWSKEAYPTNPFENDKPFPKEIDVTGDGFVYFIDDASFDGAKGAETAVDTPVYEAWVKHYIGGAEAITVNWLPADAYGIKTLETNERTTERK